MIGSFSVWYRFKSNYYFWNLYLIISLRIYLTRNSKMKFFILFLCLIVKLSESFARDAHFLSDEYIDRINRNQNSWQAGRNFDPNTSLSDIKILMGTIMEGRDHTKSYVKTFDPQWPSAKKLPKHFDARKKWRKCPRIRQVLDQGNCGSCWAIAAAQAFSDRFCIASHFRIKRRLSTANVLSCCQNCGNGCKGGYENMAWRYFNTDGLPSGGTYNTAIGCQPYNIQSPCKRDYDSSPYRKCPVNRGTPSCPNKCTNQFYGKIPDQDTRFTSGEYKLPADEHAIMKEIMTLGPVTASFNVRDDFLYYKSGVYEPASWTNSIGGHAVKLLGWGVEKNVSYWLVMNSWNKYWGDRGLIKMKRGSPMIKLEEEVWAAKPRIRNTNHEKTQKNGSRETDDEKF